MSLRRITIALLAAAPLATADTGQAQTKLIIGMPTTPPNIVLMPLHVGKELGFFKQEGIDIEIVELEGGVKAYRAMVAGSVDISSSPGPFSIVGRAKGAPTKIILSNSPKLEASMVVQKEIKTLADLKGKKIGIQEPGGFADMLARAVLRAGKVDPKDVSFVSIMSEDVPPLVARQIDSAILHIEQEIFAKREAARPPRHRADVGATAQAAVQRAGGFGEIDRNSPRRNRGLRQGPYQGHPHDVHRSGKGAADPGQVHRSAS